MSIRSLSCAYNNCYFSTVAKHSSLSPPSEEDKNMLPGISPTPSRRSDRSHDSEGHLSNSKFGHLKDVVNGREMLFLTKLHPFYNHGDDDDQ